MDIRIIAAGQAAAVIVCAIAGSVLIQVAVAYLSVQALWGLFGAAWAGFMVYILYSILHSRLKTDETISQSIKSIKE